MHIDDIHVHIHNHSDQELLLRILHHQEKIMASLDALTKAVTAEDTVIDSALVLIQGMADQIKNLQPTQAAIDALAADVQAKSDALAAAVAANTPATPAP
jgi:hypothetical protein